MTQIKNNKIALLLLGGIVAITVVVAWGLLGSSVFAETPKDVACGVVDELVGGDGTPCGKADTNESKNSITRIATTIVGILSVVAGAVAVIFLVIGGIKYATSSGNPEKVKSAKSTILAALIGFAIIIATQFILNVAISFTEELTTPTPAEGQD